MNAIMWIHIAGGSAVLLAGTLAAAARKGGRLHAEAGGWFVAAMLVLGAFFIATGSFFLGQQDALPAAVRGSPWLFVPAFAPFGLMLFWLVRLRFAREIGRLKLRAPLAAAPPFSEMEI